MRSRNGTIIVPLVLALGCALGSACVMEERYTPPPPPTPVPDLVEDRTVYDQDALEVITVNVTVPDLAALAAVDDQVPGAKAAAVFQEGAYGADAQGLPNATIELRGSSSRNADQRSYKVKLLGAPWRNLTKLNLSKHPFDLTRARNRLSLEYMRSIPNFASLRTQFVHLLINGNDLGLFENVENPGKTYLAAHGLPVGELYKANNFAFYELTSAQLATTTELDKVLESKGIDTDHVKLEAMLKDINDPFIETDYIFTKWFNRDNYVTWLAINVLFGDFDTSNQNFMIYSPPDTDGWYFLPWDYDGAWGFNGPDGQPGTVDRARNRLGLGTWWLSPLHQRFLRDPANRALLAAKMDELLATVISDDKTRAHLAQYHDLIGPLVAQAPDVNKLPDNHAPSPAASIAAWETEYARIGGQLSRDYDAYYAALDVPMTIFQADPELSSGRTIYRWDASFDFQGDPLTYTVQVSRTPGFAASDLVLSKAGLTGTSYTGPGLPAGEYYWRVLISDDHGNAQQSAELYTAVDGTHYDGVRTLTVP